MPTGPAARITDSGDAPAPPVLTGGPSPNVLIGYLMAWKGIPLAAAPGIMAANAATEATLQALETAAKVAEVRRPPQPERPARRRRLPPPPPPGLAAETAKATSAATNGASIGRRRGLRGPACMPARNHGRIPPHGPGVVINGSPTVMIEIVPPAGWGTIIEAIGPPNTIGWAVLTVIMETLAWRNAGGCACSRGQWRRLRRNVTIAQDLPVP
ncbi:MAG: hypothetical protein IPF66_25260 [Holophagales bacterium]|nr:hypothetical protein [Holophagales bacterium]